MSKKVLVVIDPGHVGSTYNAGAVKGYYESMAVWKLSQYEKTALESYGIKVIITKKNINDSIPLYDRGQIAVKNAKGYDEVVFESNHTNAANGKACGVSVIRSAHLPNSAALGKKIANAVVNVMKPTTGITYNRGVTTRQNTSNTADWYGVIRGAVSGAKTKCQAASGPVQYDYIVEHGFHDNAVECKFLAVDANLKKIAEAKAKAIAEYFGFSKNTASAPSDSAAAVKESNLVKYTKSLQTALNAAYSAGLAVDGSAGPLTQSCINKYYLYYKMPTIKNAHVSWLQTALKALGYSITVDGSFGPATQTTVKQFQKDKKLDVDGYAGVKTHLKILSLI